MENDECSILVTASSSQTAIALIQRLVRDDIVDQNTSSVPWTITNKYYTANVQFVIHQLSSWVLNEEQLLSPAILFVWIKGEPYREHISKLSEQISEHEFEAALAIRLPPADPSSHVENEDEEDIDAYLSSKDFEFVDVVDSDASLPDRSGELTSHAGRFPASSQEPVQDPDQLPLGIPGVPRIIDALSTIMWPSMVRQATKRDTGTGMMPNNLSSSSSVDYDHLVRLVSQKVSGADKDRMRQELEELERWLDEDMSSSDTDAPLGDDDTDPWSTAVSPGTASPTLSGFIESSRPTTPRGGFDDDFTSFVSAPPSHSVSIPQSDPQNSSSPRSVPPLSSTSFSSTFHFDTMSPSSSSSTPTLDDNASMDTSYLAPGEKPFGVSYRSLGSVSDFGDLEKESSCQERISDEEGDEDMPSKQEIAETSRRIFGSMSLSLSPSQEIDPQTEQTLAARGEAPLRSQADEEDIEMMDADLERFDLQSVLGALQGLKEEIAGMPDKERRVAAARVALGLAYGLDDQLHS